jgi:type IV pilus assembly protein PilA
MRLASAFVFKRHPSISFFTIFSQHFTPIGDPSVPLPPLVGTFETAKSAANSYMHYYTSYKAAYRGFTLVEIMIVVVIIGLLATMAIPAFQRVTKASQDKAVLNNARQLSSAADQYFMESGVSTVTLNDLIGPTTYIKALNSVASESYPSAYTAGITITVNAVGGTRTITYEN